MGPDGDPGTFVNSYIGPHLLSVLPVKAVSRKVRLQKLLAPLHSQGGRLVATGGWSAPAGTNTPDRVISQSSYETFGQLGPGRSIR